jgi:hypothetical protein
MDGVPSETARNIVLSIGASFVASGFIAWGLLQAREIMSSVADWIRGATERRRERWRRESYLRGYADAQEGKPPQWPSGDSQKNGSSSQDQSGSNSNDGGES